MRRTLERHLATVRRHGVDFLYPVSAALVVWFLTGTAVAPVLEAALAVEGNHRGSRPLLLLAVFAAYGVLYFVVELGNVGMVASMAARLDGTTTSVSATGSRVFRRLPLVARYSLVCATRGLMGYLARLLVDPIFGTFLAPAIGRRLSERRWRMSCDPPLVMALPVIALADPTPRDFLRQADRLVRDGWGECVRPSHRPSRGTAIAWLSFTVLVATPVLRRGLAGQDPALVHSGLLAMLLATSTYVQVNAFGNALFALAAYRYLVNGKRDLFPEDSSFAEGAFVSRSSLLRDGRRRPASGRVFVRGPIGVVLWSRSAAEDPGRTGPDAVDGRSRSSVARSTSFARR